MEDIDQQIRRIKAKLCILRSKFKKTDEEVAEQVTLEFNLNELNKHLTKKK